MWERYRWYIVGAALLIAVETALVAALLINRRRRRRLIHELGERVKELTALHHTASILQDESKSVPELLREIVSLLPPVWQYPEVTAGRITPGGHEFKTPDFSPTKWSQTARFKAGNLDEEVEVVYLAERPEEDAREEIGEMVGLVDTTINTVRRISSELRPSVLDDLGLIPAIEWHAQQFQEQTGIVCRFDSLVEHVELNRDQATAVFRIFQEAMTNVLRHAQATKLEAVS